MGDRRRLILLAGVGASTLAIGGPLLWLLGYEEVIGWALIIAMLVCVVVFVGFGAFGFCWLFWGWWAPVALAGFVGFWVLATIYGWLFGWDEPPG